MPYTKYMIGTTLVGLTDLKALSTPIRYPHGEYDPYSKTFDLGSGLQRGGGWPTATWHWDLLNAAERTMLRSFVPGNSSLLYIATRVNDGDTFLAFQAVMLWPEKEPRDFLRRLNFDISFRAMVAQ